MAIEVFKIRRRVALNVNHGATKLFIKVTNTLQSKNQTQALTLTTAEIQAVTILSGAIPWIQRRDGKNVNLSRVTNRILSLLK
jgi:hypothetical protein